jgi:hypothetical protein
VLAQAQSQGAKEMKTVIEMAREAGIVVTTDTPAQKENAQKVFERFAELVRADERNRTWTQDHWTEYERSIAADEREACAQTVEGFYGSREEYAAAIRARGQA